MKLYSIWDSKTEAYLAPLLFENIPTAIRALQGPLTDPQHNFCKFPEDYSLFELAEWDENTAKITVHSAPLHVVNLHELKPKNELLPRNPVDITEPIRKIN